MKLKKVCLVLFGVLFLLLLTEISCIANYNQEENLIGEEDRRAADYDRDANKRGLYEPSGTHNRHQTYPSGYGGGEAATFSSPGYAPGPPAYQPSGYSSGSYGLFGQSGHGVNFGHTEPSYGHGATFGHSAPSYGHGGHGGHSALALKGLLIPLAGIALLGAAAALSSNPVLLQLGVVNGRRRRRRSFNTDTYLTNHRIKSLN